jgi:hypothetical protein
MFIFLFLFETNFFYIFMFNFVGSRGVEGSPSPIVRERPSHSSAKESPSLPSVLNKVTPIPANDLDAESDGFQSRHLKKAHKKKSKKNPSDKNPDSSLNFINDGDFDLIDK